MSAMVFAYADRKIGIWGVRAGPLLVKLKAPHCRPLYSERNRRKVFVVPLGRGWRVNVCWTAAPEEPGPPR